VSSENSFVISFVWFVIFIPLSLVDALRAATKGLMARLYSKQDIGSPCQTPLSTFIGAGVTLFIITEVLALLVHCFH